ncbi:MAG: class I SAM-dependent methyltransferase, partial [Verrucomicrobiota bacterium]
LEPGMRVLDIGCGTGTFAAQAAKRGLSVDAADVSETMLDAAGRKCEALGVRFHHAGFLTLELEETSIDVITTTFAFHHLPDFWKGIALNRISKFLKEGGVFYLRDVILESRDPLDKIGEFISEQYSLGGDFLRIDAEGHFRDEHSTYDWVMDGLLDRSGFSVTSRTFEQGVLGTYVCRKVE